MPQGGVAVAGQRLCSGGSTGRGVLGLGAALAWGMRYRGARAVLIGRRSVLGVRARDGNLAGDLGVTVARAEGAEEGDDRWASKVSERRGRRAWRLSRAERAGRCAGTRGGAGLGRERGIGLEERSAGWAKETGFVG